MEHLESPLLRHPFILLLAFLPWFGAEAQTPSTKPLRQECTRRELTVRPGWTISGAFTPDGKTLLLVDALNNQILSYTSEGRSKGPISLADRLSYFLPSVIKSDGAKLLLEMAVTRFVALDSSLAPTFSRDVLRSTAATEPKLESMFLWDVAGNDLVSFGDFVSRSGSWEAGFARIPLRNAEVVSLLHRYSFGDPVRLFNRLGHPYVSSIGSTAYFLEMSTVPRLIRSRKDTTEWQALATKAPGMENPLPTLPPFNRGRDFARVMKAVGKSTMPVGLYRSKDKLIVLTRNFNDKTLKTTWSLTRIDPVRDRLIWSKVLPLQADHVTVVPGPQNWVFVEKGPVINWGDQDIKTLFFVPTSAVEDDRPGLLLCTDVRPGL